MKAYLAAPIFTERDRNFNTYLESEILKRCPDLNLYLAQNNNTINDKTGCANSADIYVGDITRLKESDILITIMSGDLPPIGSSYEVAYFCGLCEQDPRRRIIALYDDSREANHTYSTAKRDAMISGIAENQFPYINLLAVGFVKKWGNIYRTSEELIAAVEKEYNIGCEKKPSGIYKITNLKNGLIYIGQSHDIYTRWRTHKNNGTSLISKDIQALGLDYFKFEIIEICSTDSQLIEREKYWIEYYDSYNNGYNETTGGESGNINSKLCEPISCYDLKGNYIKSFHSGSAASREFNISIGALFRCIAYNDSFHSCGNMLWRRGNNTSNIEPYVKTIPKNQKYIYGYDPNTRLFKVRFESQTEAGIQLTGSRQPHISDVLRGKRKTCAGYIWAYDYYERLPDDYNFKEKEN